MLYLILLLVFYVVFYTKIIFTDSVGSIYGHIFEDTNYNGKWDKQSDNGLSNIKIEVTTEKGTKLYATTDKWGWYTVKKVPTGIASVKVVTSTLPNQHNFKLVIGSDPTDVTVKANNETWEEHNGYIFSASQSTEQTMTLNLQEFEIASSAQSEEAPQDAQEPSLEERTKNLFEKIAHAQDLPNEVPPDAKEVNLEEITKNLFKKIADSQKKPVKKVLPDSTIKQTKQKILKAQQAEKEIQKKKEEALAKAKAEENAKRQKIEEARQAKLEAEKLKKEKARLAKEAQEKRIKEENEKKMAQEDARLAQLEQERLAKEKAQKEAQKREAKRLKKLLEDKRKQEARAQALAKEKSERKKEERLKTITQEKAKKEKQERLKKIAEKRRKQLLMKQAKIQKEKLRKEKLKKEKQRLTKEKMRKEKLEKKKKANKKLTKRKSKDGLANSIMNAGASYTKRKKSNASMKMIKQFYGSEFNSFTGTQKTFIEKNLGTIYQITQRTLTRNGYPRVAARTQQQGTQLVTFYLHPNGSISGLHYKKRLGFASLDKNTMKIIKIAYKDYPRPKTTTKITFYVQYSLF